MTIFDAYSGNVYPPDIEGENLLQALHNEAFALKAAGSTKS